MTTTRGFAWTATLLLTTSSLLIAPSMTRAESKAPLQITITSKGFDPARLQIPAGKKVKIMVHNATALPAEFESYQMPVEKVVPGHTDLPVYIGPLKPGSYKFFNDFAANVTGTIIVK